VCTRWGPAVRGGRGCALCKRLRRRFQGCPQAFAPPSTATPGARPQARLRGHVDGRRAARDLRGFVGGGPDGHYRRAEGRSGGPALGGSRAPPGAGPCARWGPCGRFNIPVEVCANLHAYTRAVLLAVSVSRICTTSACASGALGVRKRTSRRCS